MREIKWKVCGEEYVIPHRKIIGSKRVLTDLKSGQIVKKATIIVEF